MATWVRESPCDLTPSFTVDRTAKFSILEACATGGDSSDTGATTPKKRRAMQPIKSEDVVMTDADGAAIDAAAPSKKDVGGKKGAAIASGGKAGSPASDTPAKKGMTARSHSASQP